MSNKVYQKNFEYRLRKFGKKYYLFSPNKSYELNEIGKLIWENIDGEKDLSTIVDHVMSTYDVNESQAQSDVRSFIENLQTIGAIL